MASPSSTPRTSGLPHVRTEFLGVTIDTDVRRGTAISVDAPRREKLCSHLDKLLINVRRTDTVPNRGQMASAVGKLQWCCPAVHQGQLRLVRMYSARDIMATSPSSQLPPNRRWDPDELCVLDAGAYEDLEWWCELLSAGATAPTPQLADPLKPLERSSRRAAPTHPGLWSKTLFPYLPSDDRR